MVKENCHLYISPYSHSPLSNWGENGREALIGKEILADLVSLWRKY